jgi:hypothetical protein
VFVNKKSFDGDYDEAEASGPRPGVLPRVCAPLDYV